MRNLKKKYASPFNFSYWTRTNPCKVSRLLRRMFQAGQKTCFYCGIPVRLAAVGQHALDPDNATLEHLYSALDMRRTFFNWNEAVVVSCYRCNNNRGSAEFNAVYNNEFYKEKDYSKGTYPNLLIELLINTPIH